MSNHEAACSSASDTLTRLEIERYNGLLLSKGAVLLQHPAVVRGLLEQSGPLDRAFGSLIPSADPHAPARRQWEAFYQKRFGLVVDFSKVIIPAQRDGFTRLEIVAQGIMLNTAMAVCKKCFPTWQYYDDLDTVVTYNDRTAQGGAYAVWFCDRIEADEEMADRSAKQLSSNGVKGITLLERILMELEYFDRTGQHLDLRNWTLCAGSRSSDGSVPRCSWYGAKFSVGWTFVGNRNPNLRVREAVS